MGIMDSEQQNAPRLNLPSFDMKIAKIEGKVKIYDLLRKKYVTLTPEEYVRQHFVNWMINHLYYPASILANEVSIELNDTHRRCDTVVFSPGQSPLMIIEYKAPSVTVSQQTFDQIVRYNMVLKARYLVVSNGFRHYCCAIDYTTGRYNFIPKVPEYPDILHGSRDN